MNNTNIEIREAMIRAGLRQWQVAEAIGIAEESLSRKLREELGDAERDRIIDAIERIPAKRIEITEMRERLAQIDCLKKELQECIRHLDWIAKANTITAGLVSATVLYLAIRLG